MRQSQVTLVLGLAVLSCGGPAVESRRDPAVVAQAARPTPRASRSQTSPEPAAPAEPANRFEGAPALDVLRGRASYYSDRLAGRRTASGERYQPRELTAASRDLPFGTIVRVIREDTGASVIVRVNDRGPFRDHTRILDLSRAAAEALGMLRAGVVAIRAEIIERPP